MTEIDAEIFDTSSNLKVKPLYKPDVHLKKSRQRVFSENSVDLIYSFGYQASFGHNLCMLKENIIIIISGNHLNFLNIDILTEDFLPSINGAGFTYVAVHPSTYFFAAAEKGRKFCINIFSYPALEACKTLKNDSAIMPTSMMQFHPRGDILIALSCDPENKIYIWHWEFESVLYISSDSCLPIYNMHFSPHKKDIFVTSGKEHVIFWRLSAVRDDRDIITQMSVTPRVEKAEDLPKLDVYCTVSISDTYLSATDDGYLLFWNPELLIFDSVIKISFLDGKPCHKGCIWHIIIYTNYIITFGSDGYMKFWNYDQIIDTLNAEEEDESEQEEEKRQKSTAIIETDEKTGACKITAIHTYPEKEFLISSTSDLVYGIITKIKFDDISFLIQDRNGILFQVVIAIDLSNISVIKLLSGLGCSIVGLIPCPFYPFIAVASSLGNVAVYDCVDQTVYKFGTFPISISCIIWPSAKLNLFASSFLIGFCDGTIKWVAFSQDSDNFSLKFVIKPHTIGVELMKMNESSTILISQGSDSKLFFYSVESFSLFPLGYYIVNHEIIDFAWLKHSSSSSLSEKYYETILILCKNSYIIECAIPDRSMCKDSVVLRKTYFIENEDYQVYKINGLRQYHELGDKIYDSDCEEVPDLTEVGKAGLRKLKYDEKKERRESFRLELGFSGPVTPPEILSYLPSDFSNRIWLSLGKEDFGYIFEFEFQGQFTREPIELVPIRALEILTAAVTPVLSMQYSPCGKFIFMGLQDGSLNLCYLDEPFIPSSGYDFAKYQFHDPDVGPVVHVKVSSEGSFITTAGYDGNILLYKFNMFEYQEIEDYGEKPFLSDVTEIEDISAKKLSVEEEIKHQMNEKYQKMEESRVSVLETLKEEYSLLKNDYSEYLDLCKTSLKKLKDIPEELKINPEELSFSETAAKMLTKATDKLLKDIDVHYQEEIIRSTLQYYKYFKFFKEKVEQEVLTVKDDKQNIALSNFRSCVLPSIIQDVELGSYPCLIKPQEKASLQERKMSEKVWDERIKLENKLAATRKAIIEYPSDTPVSDLVSRYNKRKEEQIIMLQEHIDEYEALKYIVSDDQKYKETIEEIKASQFKFKESAELDHLFPEYGCSFSEKKTRTAIYFKQIHKFWKNFNSLLLTALNYKKQEVESSVIDPNSKENATDSSEMINSHIYYKKGTIFGMFKDPIKIIWNLSDDDKNVAVEEMIKSDDILEFNKEKMLFQERICHYFMTVLMAAKPKLSCEKKFCDTRFILKCIELNSFKADLMKEKRWLKIINELENLLYEENFELSVLQEKMLVLKNKRQAEKNEWMNLYNQFKKVIGLKNKHKGYFKTVFKKKIRSDDEKESHSRHPSSESSESEQDIKSDDDARDINPEDVDKDLLKEVMRFRLKRHEIEKRMKRYKRDLLAHNTKQIALQRKLQKIKDALEEAWRTLNTIPSSRMLEIRNIIWPVVLYPENVHKDFLGKATSAIQEQKVLIHEKMSKINETVLKELKPIDKLIKITLIKLTEKVINAELMDLIDIACIFFPLVDNVAKDADEYFRKITCPDSSEALEKVVALEKKHINVIQEILSAAAAKESELGKDSEIETSSKEDILSVKANASFKEDAFKETNDSETMRVEYLNNLADLEIPQVKKSSKEKTVLKSWREEVCDVDEETSSSKIAVKDIDIKSFISDAVPTLDTSLFAEDKCLPVEDYYMLPLRFEKAEEFQEKISEQTNLTYTDFAKLLFELDVSDILQGLIRRVVEEEESAKTVKLLSDGSFPTYPGGGLFLTRDVLVAMEIEDADFFPYTDFYQEIVDDEEQIEIPKQVHVEPHYKEMALQYDLSLVSEEDFILLYIDDVLGALKAYNDIKISTSQCEQHMRILEKKLSKARNKRVSVEQELVAVSREKTEEMTKKFSRIMDLEHLQDIIENPHLRIRKYESDKKLDLLKRDLRKLKAFEIKALKSLDILEYEDTLTCHELLKLRQEFKLLNQKHSSNLKNFSSRCKEKVNK